MSVAAVVAFITQVQTNIQDETDPHLFVDSDFMEQFWKCYPTFQSDNDVPKITPFQDDVPGMSNNSERFAAGRLSSGQFQYIENLTEYMDDFEDDLEDWRVLSSYGFTSSAERSVFETWIGTPGSWNYTITQPNSLNLFSVLADKLDPSGITKYTQIPKCLWELVLMYETYLGNAENVTQIETILESDEYEEGYIPYKFRSIPKKGASEMILELFGKKFG